MEKTDVSRRVKPAGDEGGVGVPRRMLVSALSIQRDPRICNRRSWFIPRAGSSAKRKNRANFEGTQWRESTNLQMETCQ